MYILLLIPLLFLIAIYIKKTKVKEPMIGYCISNKPMPYHIKEVTTNNTYLAPGNKQDSKETSRLLKRKIKSIRKALEDKANWEYNKINSYSKYSNTKPNDLVIGNNIFFLNNSEQDSINPVVTQFNKNTDTKNTYTINDYEKLYVKNNKYIYTPKGYFDIYIPDGNPNQIKKYNAPKNYQLFNEYGFKSYY